MKYLIYWTKKNKLFLSLLAEIMVLVIVIAAAFQSRERDNIVEASSNKNGSDSSSFAPIFVSDANANIVRSFDSSEMNSTYTIVDLTCDVLNSNPKAVKTNDSFIFAPVDIIKNSGIYFYPLSLDSNIVVQDSEVGFFMAIKEAEMMTGIIKMNGEERNAVKYKIKGDVLDGVGENPEKGYSEESSSYPSDDSPTTDKVGIRLVICGDEKAAVALIEQISLVIEVEAYGITDDSTKYIVANRGKINPLS